MINRAIAIGADQFPYLGRLNNITTTEKKSTFESKQMGKRDNKIFMLTIFVLGYRKVIRGSRFYITD